jgi:hypothetical protein
MTTVTLSVSEDSFTVSISTVIGETPVMTEIKGTIPITSSNDGDTSPITVDELPLTPQPGNGGGSVAVTGVSLNKTTLSLDVGGSEILIAIVVPANATNKAVTWSNSNTAVATVTSGTVTAMSAGRATITVTTEDSKKTATCNVTVNNPLTPATLASYMATLPVNTVNTAYSISLKINRVEDFAIIKAAIQGSPPNNYKYVNLDLTGSTVTSIGDDAFRYCPSLVSITIPNSATSIGRYAFAVSENLTGITIPNSVTSIGENAFGWCSSLASVILGSGVTRIGDSVFTYCTSLARVTIPNSVINIGRWAFNGCTSLASVTIPDSVTSIGLGAFIGCTSLTSVKIPDGVTAIEEGVFSICTSLSSVTIPNGVTSIGNQAFISCTNLVSVTFQCTIPSSGFNRNAFSSDIGDLRDKFYATDSTNGTPGTYTRISGNKIWMKQ